MEYNNQNIDLVKSLVHFFKFSESNKIVLFNLEQKTFKYVDEFSQVFMPEGYNESEQTLIRRPMVLIDCRNGSQNSVRIANYMTRHALRLQLPLYVATQSIFICVIPSSAALLNIARVQNNSGDLEKLKLQYKILLEPYLLEVTEAASPSTLTLENVFKVFQLHPRVL